MVGVAYPSPLLLPTVKDNSFSEDREYPFSMEFDAVITFDSSVSDAPTLEEAVDVMYATEEDYQDYILFHVWPGPMGDIFYDVNSAYFSIPSDRTGSPIGAPTTFPPTAGSAVTLGPSVLSGHPTLPIPTASGPTIAPAGSSISPTPLVMNTEMPSSVATATQHPSTPPEPTTSPPTNAPVPTLIIAGTLDYGT